MRVLSARLGDGRLLAIAALRPTGADGPRRGAGRRRARRARARSSSSTRRCSRPSTGPTACPRRVGLELYPAARRARDRGSPATSTAVARSVAGGVERSRRADAALRGGGDGAGAGVLDTARARVKPPADHRGDLRLRRRPHHAAAGLVRRLPGPDRDLGRVARARDAGDRRARRRPPAVRARDRADDRGRLPRRGWRRRSSPSSATGPRCTASARSTSRRWSRTSR